VSEARILIVPGLHGSGPGHWQSVWESRIPGCSRVMQGDWDTPSLEPWIESLHRSVARCAVPPLLVAHSLGCVVVAHFARRFALEIRAALLVAPCDVETPLAAAANVGGFGPVPTEQLPFPSFLVASTGDPWLGLERARDLSRAWRSGLVVIEGAGHINVESGFGPWPQGELLLERLVEVSGSTAPAARSA
jgi:uncharacterized protein